MYRSVVIGTVLALSSVSASAQLVSAQLSYPPAALRAGHEGAVGYEVKVAKDGRVTGCRVTQTSGHTDLDEETCSELRKFARFKPMTGPDGKPAKTSFAGRLRWAIPRPASESAPAAAQ